MTNEAASANEFYLSFLPLEDIETSSAEGDRMTVPRDCRLIGFVMNPTVATTAPNTFNIFKDGVDTTFNVLLPTSLINAGSLIHVISGKTLAFAKGQAISLSSGTETGGSAVDVDITGVFAPI